MKNLLKTRLFGGIIVGAFSAALMFNATDMAKAQQGQEVNIYSYRQPDLIKPLTDAFTAKSGIKTNILFLDKGLEERIAAEGENSPADIILSTDVSKLELAVSRGIVAKLANAEIEKNIPAQFRDPNGNWFGLTMRARIVYASKERVRDEAITYEQLADPEWKGRICIRDGQHAYNLGLFASMVARHGEQKAEQWLKGVKANLARRPTGNDRAQAKSIFAGECDIGLGNSYYVGLMMTNKKAPEQKEWAASLKFLFPNAEDRGTHVNISGMALARHAPNYDNAVKLMEFLASSKAQEIYAEQVYEYPLAPGTKPSDLVRSFGVLKPDALPLSEISKNRNTASVLVDRTGFNDGAD